MIWRYLLAIGLSMLVIVAWGHFFPPPPARKGGEVQPGAAPIGGKIEPPAKEGPAERAPAAAPAARPERPAASLEVQSGEDVRALVEARGGMLPRLWLVKFHESVEKAEPYQLLFPAGSAPGTLALELEGCPIPPDENWEFRREEDREGRPVAVLENEVDGIHLTKRIAPGGGAGDGYDLQVSVTLENRGAEPIKARYKLYGPCGIDTESLRGEGDDISLVQARRPREGVVHVTVSTAASLPQAGWKGTEDFAWVGVSNNYFFSILVPGAAAARVAEIPFAEAYPDENRLRALAEAEKKNLADLGQAEREALEKKTYKNLRVGLTGEVRLGPGERLEREYTLFAGPRDRDVFARREQLNFEGVNDYGTFAWLVKFFIWLLALLKGVAFQSWGLAIVLLTFLVKLCLHPINKRSQASMQRFQKKMQKMKPEMDEVKERYADNRLKQQQEMQRLFKEHGLNPAQQMGGCLILFLQLPIWYALYSTLQYALGLRQAGFLYIEDLTRADQLFHIGLHLPWLGDFFEWFNLLPILYVILTVVNQSLQPKPDDPQMRAQFRMMTFMLVFFGFIFYNFPAGFMLYIMTSSALGIIESKIIKAELRREEGEPGNTVKGSAGGPQSGSNSGGSMYPARTKKSEDASPRVQEPFRTRRKR